jgi:hypothetical protein
MSKAGSAPPIEIRTESAIVLCRWLHGFHAALYFGEPTVAVRFLSVHHDALRRFARKLEKGLCRRGREKGESITLWTVDREEATAAYGYFDVVLNFQRSDLDPHKVQRIYPPDVEIALLHVTLVLRIALRPRVGHPKRTLEQAARLLDEYRGTPSGLRHQFSGRRVREAKKRIADEEYNRRITAAFFGSRGPRVDRVFHESLADLLNHKPYEPPLPVDVHQLIEETKADAEIERERLRLQGW